MFLESTAERTHAAILLMGASAMLYAGSRAAVFALARPDGADPGRRAAGQWAPIALTALTAVLLKQSDVALAIVFGTSVACLSLVLGLATYLAPLQSLPPSKRIWPFVFPVALLALMAGFSGHLNGVHALMLLAIGGAILNVWIETDEGSDGSSEIAPRPSAALLILIAAVPAMVVGAILAVKGTVASSNPQLSPATIAATILSPLLILPTLGSTSTVAQGGYPGRAMTCLVGTVLLNLCLLLPMVILLWYPVTLGRHFAGAGDFFSAASASQGMNYPQATWRIETVILLILGFGLVALSMGQWAMSRLESILLVVGYVVYVGLVTILGMQGG